MSPILKNKILEKLKNFDEYLGYLKILKKEAKTEKIFISDFHLFGNTERYLQLCIQSIIADLNLEKPNDNYEAVSMLYNNSIISENLEEKITKCCKIK